MTIQDEIAKTQRRIEQLRFQLAVEEQLLERLSAINCDIEANPITADRPTVKGSVASHIIAVLRSSHGPMDVDDITEALRRRGVSTDAKTGLKPLVGSAISRRKDIFVRVKRGVYDLSERQQKKPEETPLTGD